METSTITPPLANRERWARWREMVFLRDGFRCVDCGAASQRRAGGLEPHHIWPKAAFHERLYDLSNGVTLCRPCHRATFGKEQTVAPKYEAYVNALLEP